MTREGIAKEGMDGRCVIGKWWPERGMAKEGGLEKTGLQRRQDARE